MYYQNYEDYMRNILGYPIPDYTHTYDVLNYNEYSYDTSNIPMNSTKYSSGIMDLYPEIYRIVNPMICKICDANTKPIDNELIEKMTEEIYLNLENVHELDTVVNIRVNAQEQPISNEKNIRTSNMARDNKSSVEKNDNRISKTEKEDRYRRDNTLRDLIKILILNRLLGNNNQPIRPPRPRPPRPPIRPPYARDDIYLNNDF